MFGNLAFTVGRKSMDKPTDKMIIQYILTHSSEDYLMDQTLDDFYKKVNEWYEWYTKEVSERLP